MPYQFEVKCKGGDPRATYAKVWGDNPTENTRLARCAHEPVKAQSGHSPSHVDVPARKFPWLVRLGIVVGTLFVMVVCLATCIFCL